MDQQQEFRTRHGTVVTLFIAKRINQISDQLKKPAYALFLTAAFDHVDRMFESIANRLPQISDGKLIALLQKLCSRTTTALV